MNYRLFLALIILFPLFSPAQGILTAADKSDYLEREDSAVLQRYNPFYFGYNAHLSKLQLSFKLPVVRGVPLYFGYTQVMFWALNEKSKPFRDLTYNPDLFYRFNFKDMGLLKFVDAGLWSHHSNGKKDSDSRSYNMNYLRAGFEHEYSRWILRTTAQLSYVHDFDPTNRDIQRYVGPLTLGLSFIQLFDSWIDKSEIGLMMQAGGKFADQWDEGGYQLSWSFRLGKFALVPNLYLQYYQGYAETLLNYNKTVSEFRGGVIF